ncbi:hypothetical protein SAY86_009314 [Trapa natans]|uniref:Uncharacterized protein n=1 Tax=Trapa natans TaxID=22666 RepID=A0AAN7QPQ7_TRANT|nr:hypothetical protein SAY86_009314 [Trapa natans]
MMMQQPDMIHCVDAPKLTVLERQRARLLKWQLEQGTPPLFQQQTQSYYNDAAGGSSSSFPLGIENSMGLGQVLNQCKMMNTSPGIEDWSPLGKIEVPCHAIGDGMGADSSPSYEASYGSISRTASCPPTVAMAAADGYVAVAVEKLSAPVGRDSLKKRKLETLQSIKVFFTPCPHVSILASKKSGKKEKVFIFQMKKEEKNRRGNGNSQLYSIVYVIRVMWRIRGSKVSPTRRNRRLQSKATTKTAM